MGHAVAVDLGGTNIRAALIDHEGQILKRADTPTQAKEGFKAVVGRIANLIQNIGGDHPVGIGLGTPGAPDPHSGIMMSPAVNIPDSPGYPLGPELAEKTGLPVALDNDANLAALAEAWLGAAQNEPVALLLTLGTGIGGGLLIDGSIYHGLSNITEIGHTCISWNGRECACGCVGCFEAYASARAFGRDTQEALKAGGEAAKKSRLWELCGGRPEKADARLLCDAAREGDAFAENILDQSCEYLAAGTGSLVNALNPSCVMFGGGLALAGEVLFSRVRAALTRNRAFAPVWERCKLVPAKLGDDAGLLGAARLAFQHHESFG